MQSELFCELKRFLRRLGRRRSSRRQLYTDATILEVFLWAVLNDRPVLWACARSNWPPGLRRGPLPSQSVVSRRLRTALVVRLRCRLEKVIIPRVDRPTLVCVMDAKALPVARHSGDRHAGFGRGAGNMAKGYKFHATVDLQGRLLGWRLASMSRDERVMAVRLIRDLPPCAYLLADTQYDSNKLFALAANRGVQLVAPRRHGGPGKGLGHIPHHPTRLRSKHLTEESPYGADLVRHRRSIERFFASLTNFGGSLTCLPPWVRTYPRVHAWVQAKLMVLHLRRSATTRVRHHLAA